MKKSGIRLNKYISHNSRYSRREADALIEKGAVTLGSRVVKDYSCRVNDGDVVFVNGKRIEPRRSGEFTLIVYNKPKGVLVSKRDDRGRTTIYHKLPGKFRHFIPVGRLDFASEGVLIMTDSPSVADFLMRSRMPRSYNIKIDSPLTEEMIDAMKNGLVLEDATKGSHSMSRIKSMSFSPFIDMVVRKEGKKYTKLRVTIDEGKNRELRRFFAHFGANVLDLKRVAFGPVELKNLPENKVRYFSRKEYEIIHKLLEKGKADDKIEA